MSHFKGKVDTTWGAAYYQYIGATQAGIAEQSETELHIVSKCYVTCQNPTLTNPLRESARPQADNRSIPNGIEATVIQRPFFMAAPKEAIDMQSESKTPKKIIRLRGVIARSGLSKTTIYRISNDPASDFPKPVRPTPHTVGWYESEIDAWVDSRRGGAA